MKIANFNEVMLKYFNILQIDPIEFVYDNVRNQFISNKTFLLNKNDIEEYFIRVQLIGNIGNVYIGVSDGINFTDAKMIGQIQYINDQWINL